MQSIRHLSFLHTFCKAFYALHSNSFISTPIENWAGVYMNLFTQNSSYHHLPKYLPFLMKHPVYRQHFPEVFDWRNNRINSDEVQTLLDLSKYLLSDRSCASRILRKSEFSTARMFSHSGAARFLGARGQ